MVITLSGANEFDFHINSLRPVHDKTLSAFVFEATLLVRVCRGSCTVYKFMMSIFDLPVNWRN
jgi:hypothetical protein